VLIAALLAALLAALVAVLAWRLRTSRRHFRSHPISQQMRPSNAPAGVAEVAPAPSRRCRSLSQLYVLARWPFSVLVAATPVLGGRL